MDAVRVVLFLVALVFGAVVVGSTMGYVALYAFPIAHKVVTNQPH